MSKSLYSLRPADGKVVALKNNAWTQIGAVQGFVQPRLGGEMLTTWFKFDGKLHCAFLANAKTVVARLESGDLVPVADVETDACRAAWGTAVNWGGALVWAERLEDGTSYLYRFDGTLRCDEVTGVPGVQGPFVPAVETLQLTPQALALRVLPSAIALSPAAERGKILARAYQLDLVFDGGAIRAEALSDVGSSTLNFETGANRRSISEFNIGNDEFRVTTDGWLLGINGVAKDLRIDAVEHIPIEYATSDTLVVNQKFISKLGFAVLGARFTARDGKTRTVVGMQGKILETIGDAMFEPNDEATFAPGFAAGSTSEVQAGAISRVHWMPTPRGFVVAILGRSPTAGSADRSPSVIAEWDGKKVRVRKLDGLAVLGSCAAYDASINAVHLVYLDSDSSMVRHVTYNLNSGVISAPTDLWQGNIAEHGQGVADGTFIAFEENEPDARITDLQFDAESGDFVLTIVSPNAKLLLEYTKGVNWTKAGLVDVTETGLVHHMRREEPDYVGPIQYRVSVSRA